MWGRISVGSGALFQLERNRAPLAGIVALSVIKIRHWDVVV